MALQLAAALGGSLISGLFGSSSAKKAAAAQQQAAAQQLDFEKQVYGDTVERFAPFYDGGQDYYNALRYELLGGEAPMMGGSYLPVEEFTQTVGGGAGGQPVQRKRTGSFGDMQYDPTTGQWQDAGYARDLARRRAPQAQNRAVTKYRVGDKVFGSREEAEQWAQSNPVGGQQYGGFEASPGFQFALEQGQTAIDTSAAARGGLFSGATLKAQQKFGTGLAQQEYGNYLNRLAQQAGMGQAAAGNMATAGSNFASGTGNALANSGNAQAAGYIGQANAITGGINNALGAWGYMSAQQPASTGVQVPQSLFNSVQRAI